MEDNEWLDIKSNIRIEMQGKKSSLIYYPRLVIFCKCMLRIKQWTSLRIIIQAWGWQIACVTQISALKVTQVLIFAAISLSKKLLKSYLLFKQVGVFPNLNSKL